MTPSPAWHAEMRARLYRLVDTQLRHLEDRLRPPLDVLDNPSGRALLREASDIVGLWKACEKSACRRARRCRRQAGRCVARFAPLVPPHARAQVIARLRERHTIFRVPGAAQHAAQAKRCAANPRPAWMLEISGSRIGGAPLGLAGAAPHPEKRHPPPLPPPHAGRR
ncbi:MAG: hypothetical protein WD039_08650 [Xanthobacteraceae bacterium]